MMYRVIFAEKKDGSERVPIAILPVLADQMQLSKRLILAMFVTQYISRLLRQTSWQVIEAIMSADELIQKGVICLSKSAATKK